MDFLIVSPIFFDALTSKNNPNANGLKYTVTVTPAAVEYSFPMMQEEVIKALLSIDIPIAFTAKKLDSTQSAQYVKQVDKLVKEYPFLKYYGVFKTVIMNTVQDRNYAIEKRFLLMNFMMKSLQNMLDKGDEENIGPFISHYINEANRDDIINFFKSIKPNLAFSLMDGLSMINSLPDTEKFKAVKTKIFTRLGYKEDRSDFKDRPYDAFADQYIEIKRKYYEEIIKQGKEGSKEYYIENILVGFIMSMNLPYADFSLNLWDNFAFFNIIFNVVKILLTLYVTEENLEEDIVTAITALDESFRAVSNGLARITVRSLEDRGFNTNGDMAVLAMS